MKVTHEAAIGGLLGLVIGAIVGGTFVSIINSKTEKGGEPATTQLEEPGKITKLATVGGYRVYLLEYGVDRCYVYSGKAISCLYPQQVQPTHE